MVSRKVRVINLKYAVLDKETRETSVFRFKKDMAEHIGVSVKTLDRDIYYENGRYLCSKVLNVVSSR